MSKFKEGKHNCITAQLQETVFLTIRPASQVSLERAVGTCTYQTNMSIQARQLKCYSQETNAIGKAREGQAGGSVGYPAAAWFSRGSFPNSVLRPLFHPKSTSDHCGTGNEDCCCMTVCIGEFISFGSWISIIRGTGFRFICFKGKLIGILSIISSLCLPMVVTL